MGIERKKGGDLSREELSVINLGRRSKLGSKYDLDPRPGDDDFEADFFLLKDDFDRILAFAKLEEIEILFSGRYYPIMKFSMLVSPDGGKGYGKKVMREVEKYVETQDKTALGFCETTLVPFYKKCGFEVLSFVDNQFYYLDKEGKPIADSNIVPGEVIVIRGKDGLMEKVLAGRNKRVGVYKS